MSARDVSNPPTLTEAHPFKPQSPYNHSLYFYSPSLSVGHRLVLFYTSLYPSSLS